MMLTYWPTTRPAVHESGPVPLGVECAWSNGLRNGPEPGTIITDDEAERLHESQGFADSQAGALEAQAARQEPWARIIGGGFVLCLLTAWWLL